MEQRFIQAVAAKNLIRTRLSISNELMLDPRGKTFKEMVSYAEAKLPDLYLEDDGKLYDDNTSKWDDEFLCDLKNDLDLLFSKEKLAVYEKVTKFVLKEKAKKLEEEEQNLAIQSNSTLKKYAYSGLTIGSAAAAITGLYHSRNVLSTLGFTGVVIGGLLLYKEFKK